MIRPARIPMLSLGLLALMASVSSSQTAEWPDRVAGHVVPALTAGLVQGPMLGRPDAMVVVLATDVTDADAIEPAAATLDDFGAILNAGPLRGLY